MNTNSTTPRPCAGCSRDLGYVMRTFAITYNGWRYEVCGHTNSCADRLIARLSPRQRHADNKKENLLP